MATDKKGFTLPSPDEGKPPPLPSLPSVPEINMDPTLGGASTKSLMTGAGVLVVVLALFFLLKGMYANYLVGRKVAPAKANQAGWWLWVFLGALAAAAIFSIVDQSRFLSIRYLVPLGLVAVVALVLMLLSSRR